MNRAATALVAVVSVWGCSRGDADWRMTVVGASPGGAWSAIGEAVTDELRRGIPGSAFTLEPGRDGANAALVQSGKVEMGLVHSSIALAALDGTSPFQETNPDVRAITLLYADAPFHFVVDRRAGMESFTQLREERLPIRVSVNTRGSLMELATRTVLDEYGVSYETLREQGGSVYYYPFTASYEAMHRGRLDAIGATVQVPSGHAIEASRNLDLDILALDPEVIERVNQRLGTDPDTIPADAYGFLEHEVPTFAGRVILITSAMVPEDQIYEITRVLHDQLESVRRAHRSLTALTSETMPEVGNVPLHPGALRLYRELGVR
ncbi:MAG: TAXI family TRAP transporter solute-binding subunit [Gemmatimonadetes bacterium]|nr:TAXI family TRAP transporter solute-binding subunit [Gemmatimonadota bacterium]NNM33510.1 TAXI family TRAP transporter solute-binding subunit [Gemmatimonadota bacterium]